MAVKILWVSNWIKSWTVFLTDIGLRLEFGAIVDLLHLCRYCSDNCIDDEQHAISMCQTFTIKILKNLGKIYIFATLFLALGDRMGDTRTHTKIPNGTHKGSPGGTIRRSPRRTIKRSPVGTNKRSNIQWLYPLLCHICYVWICDTLLFIIYYWLTSTSGKKLSISNLWPCTGQNHLAGTAPIVHR